jgi:hypothetical protein
VSRADIVQERVCPGPGEFRSWNFRSWCFSGGGVFRKHVVKGLVMSSRWYHLKLMLPRSWCCHGNDVVKELVLSRK